MEFNEKLQALRKQKGLTQEELAQALFVSRTAISKWESGRGYPNLDSIKAIARFFSVSVDELLSGEELLFAAESEQKSSKTRLLFCALGLLDVSFSLLLFLPVFTKQAHAVSLTALDGSPTVRIALFVGVILTVLTGVLTLAVQRSLVSPTSKVRLFTVLLPSTATTLLFILCRHPYAAVFGFALLLIKILLLTRLVSSR